MKASEFDDLFETGESVEDEIDWSKAKRPGLETRRVNVDFPGWMVTALDQTARTARRNAAVTDQDVASG